MKEASLATEPLSPFLLFILNSFIKFPKLLSAHLIAKADFELASSSQVAGIIGWLSGLALFYSISYVHHLLLLYYYYSIS